jgi:hypothetical protein
MLALFALYPMLDRNINGSTFKKSHSVSLGRNHVSGLVIDGHPLCDPILDCNINSLGRFALCNSASSDATANVKLKWVPAPDLPSDIVNNISDCECFVVCTRPIMNGEELLWNYPFAHHLSPAKTLAVQPATKKAVKRIACVKKADDGLDPATKKAVKRIASVKKADDGLDPDCVCPGDSRCKMNFCWFLNGRVLHSRRRHKD